MNPESSHGMRKDSHHNDGHSESMLPEQKSDERSRPEGAATSESVQADANSMTACACPSNTHMQSSHEENNPVSKPVFAIDWLTTRGLIRWDGEESEQWRRDLFKAQAEAAKTRQDVLFWIDGKRVNIRARGMGNGNQSRLKYSFEWQGVVVGISFDEVKDRKKNNFQLTVSGVPCLLVGATKAREKVIQMIGKMGGVVCDEWVARLDMCLDVPGLSIDDWMYDSYLQGKFKTSFHDWRPYEGRSGCTGFSFGSVNRLQLGIYDKRREVVNKKREDYLLAMISQRWGGEFPDTAIRIEYRVAREWLRYYEMDTVKEVLRRIPDIVDKVCGTAKRPCFCFTDVPVDRKNKHQSRAGVDSRWQSLVDVMKQQAGHPSEPLCHVDRSQYKEERAIQMILGYALNGAARMGECIDSIDDLVEWLSKMFSRNCVFDNDISMAWEKRAKKYGTYDELTRFDFGGDSF